jgi:hypothetical protein
LAGSEGSSGAVCACATVATVRTIAAKKPERIEEKVERMLRIQIPVRDRAGPGLKRPAADRSDRP